MSCISIIRSFLDLHLFVPDQPVPGTSGTRRGRPVGIRLSRRLQRQDPLVPIEISSDSAAEGTANRPVPVDELPDVQQVVEISSEQPEDDDEATEVIPGPSTSHQSQRPSTTRCVL